jgi:hypothetical protein
LAVKNDPESVGHRKGLYDAACLFEDCASSEKFQSTALALVRLAEAVNPDKEPIPMKVKP